MKENIHPKYMECTVRCSCGNTWTTRATVPSMTLDLCDQCHPFYTGTQKLVDTGGRVQRFADKFGGAAQAQLEREAKKKEERAKKDAEQRAAHEAKAAEKAAKKAARAKAYEEKAAREAAKAEANLAAAQGTAEAAEETAEVLNAQAEEAAVEAATE